MIVHRLNTELCAISINPLEPSKRKNITHIVVIDNLYLNMDVPTISKKYALMLSKYMDIANVTIKLIITYPNYKIIDIDNHYIFTYFKKILYNNTKNFSCNNSHYQIIAGMCESIIDIAEGDVEVCVFTKCIMLSNDITNFLSTKNDIRLAIVVYFPYILNTNTLNKKIFHMPQKDQRYVDFCTTIINNGQLTSIKQNNSNIVNFSTKLLNNKQTLYFDTAAPLYTIAHRDKNQITAKLEYNDSFVVYKEFVNDDLPDYYDDILTAIHYIIPILYELLQHNDTEIVIHIHVQLLNVVRNIINNRRTVTEEIYKAELIYSELKCFTDSIKNKMLDQVKCKNHISDLFLRYIKKKYDRGFKTNHQHKMDNRIINNMTIFNELDSIDNILKSDNMKDFITKHDTNPPKMFDQSCDFYNSTFTLSNWYDEIQFGGAMGIIAKISSSKLIALGINSNILIENITSTFYPITDFIEHVLTHYENQPTIRSINKENIIYDNTIGAGNVVIPLYINKYHWKFSKYYMKPMLGILSSHHPLGYSKRHEMLLFQILISMVCHTFTITHINNQWIQCFISVLRTCSQISFDNKYNYGIKKFANKTIHQIPNDKNVKNYKNRYLCDNILNVMGQALSTGYVINQPNMKKIIKYVVLCNLYDIINKNLDKDIYNCILESNDVIILLEHYIVTIDTYILSILMYILSYQQMIKIMTSIYNKMGSYNQYIKHLERNYGLMSKLYLDYIREMVKLNVEHYDKLNVEKVYSMMGIKYSEYDIMINILNYVYAEHKELHINPNKTVVTEDIVKDYVNKLKNIIKLN